ncbi:MAG TPA: hypothetical protein VF676_03130 [Flavobacterium sp.]
MKHVFLLIFVLNGLIAIGQCSDQVFGVDGTFPVSNTSVTVSSSGLVGTYLDWCSSTLPYLIGSQDGTSAATGTYTFNFDPPVSAATLNLGAITNSTLPAVAEEVRLVVNGVHYSIPSAGVLNECEPLATLTPEGNIAGYGGWNGTTIQGPIQSLSITNHVLQGNPGGSVFSLFICDELALPNINTTDFSIFFDVSSNQLRLKKSTSLDEVEILCYNLQGEIIKKVQHMSGDELSFELNWPKGVYLLKISEHGRFTGVKKIAVN